jgi:hypothetical protein
VKAGSLPNPFEQDRAYPRGCDFCHTFASNGACYSARVRARPARTHSKPARTVRRFPSDPFSRRPRAPLKKMPNRVHRPLRCGVSSADLGRDLGRERNFGLIGRVIYAAFLVVGLAVSPVWAAPTASQTAATGVTYSNGVIRWERLERRPVQPKTVTRLSMLLAPGSSKLIARGRPGLAQVRVEYAQRDGGPVRQRILSTTLIRKANPRIVAQGISPATLAAFEARGLLQMVSVARGAIQMMATAYTAGSAGGGGMTASGRRAGYGIVAVDPRIIPLGTRFISQATAWRSRVIPEATSSVIESISASTRCAVRCSSAGATSPFTG